MQVVVLAGGIGAARFLKGLVTATGSTHADPQVTVIGNTADDISLFGLHISPDLDSVMYTLGGGADEVRGWGRSDETYTVEQELRHYGASPDWFTLGDRDFATHIVRTQMLNAGYSLTSVTEALAARWQLPVRLLPMTDDRVETHVVVEDPQTQAPTALHFQEWWVRHRAQLKAREFIYIGAQDAVANPLAVSAISEADLIIIPPSNPIVSVSPIINLPGVRPALAAASARIVGISPIVGNAPVRGMADACLSALSIEVSAAAVAAFYGPRSSGGLLDAWIVDRVDAHLVPTIEALGMTSQATDTVFDTAGVAEAVAETAIQLGLTAP